MAEAEEYKKYQELTFDLGTARTDEELEISGDFILVEYLDGSASIKLDNPGHDAIDLSRIKQIKTAPQKFNKIYITNTAQSGKTLKLLIGGAASFTAETTSIGNVIIQDADGNKAKVDSTTNALLVKEVTGAVETTKIQAEDGTGAYDEIHRTGNALDVNLKTSDVDLATAKLQGYDGSSWQNLIVENATNPNLRVVLYDDGNDVTTGINATNDGETPVGVLGVASLLYGYNGSSWDRVRLYWDSGNISVTATGATSAIDTVIGFEKHTWTQVNDASSTAPDIRLQGSIDGTNWFDLDTSTAIGSEMRHVAMKPVRYIRFNVVSLGDATSITVRYFGIR